MMNKEHPKLWYKKAAKSFAEAFPIGNGRLAGMVCGRIFTERIYLNEDSIWSGGPLNRNNPDALPNLNKIRQLIFEGKIKEAEQLAALTLTGTPDDQRHYQPLGDLFLLFEGGKKEVSDYTRELDLESGVVRISYRLDGYRYTREIFCSYPDQAMILRLRTDNPAGMNFLAQMGRGAMQMPSISRNAALNQDEPIMETKMWHPVGYQAYSDGIKIISPDTLFLHGSTAGENGIKFRAALKAVVDSGTVCTLGDHLKVENAGTVTLLLTASTSFRTENLEQDCIDRICRAAQKPYDALLMNHIADHSKLFSRVSLELYGPDGNEKNPLPTDERLKAFSKDGDDPQLVSLCFQYGRYLLIAGSRPGSLPVNLQGKWTAEMLPNWDSKYTININIEMNYWPAECCNLSECHEPLFDLIERMRAPGRETAKAMYGCGGFTAHHNTDLWADTAPADFYMPSTFWPLGAAWLCLHYYEHYRFTQDVQFLESAYGTMKEAAVFFLDFLIEDSKGELVTCPSISPENSYLLPDGTPVNLGAGAALDLEIIHELFDCVIRSSQRLNIDAEFRKKISESQKKLKKPEIGRYGQIQEWYGDYAEKNVGHRHFSPAFSLYPGELFTPDVSPRYAKAAAKTIERRMANWDGIEGWPEAWAVCLLSRLGESEKAAATLKKFMQSAFCPNLFNRLGDLDYAFQIDANFGLTAGVAEMLLQSHAGIVSLLPALPLEWRCGNVSGLCARGGFVVDMEWTQGRLEHATLKSLHGRLCRLRTREQVRVTCGGLPVAGQQDDSLLIFDTEVNGKYEIMLEPPQ